MTVGGGNEQADIKTFGKDSAGRPLRYKVLVKENQVISVLYNTGSKIEQMKFKECQFTKGEYGMFECLRYE